MSKSLQHIFDDNNITKSHTPRRWLLPDKRFLFEFLNRKVFIIILFKVGQFCRTCKTKNKIVTLTLCGLISISRRCLGRFSLALRICFQISEVTKGNKWQQWQVTLSMRPLSFVWENNNYRSPRLLSLVYVVSLSSSNVAKRCP